MQKKKKYITDPMKARKYLNVILNEINSETEPNIPNYRTKIYLLKTMLDFFEFEKNLQIEERLDSIEQKILEG